MAFVVSVAIGVGADCSATVSLIYLSEQVEKREGGKLTATNPFTTTEADVESVLVVLVLVLAGSLTSTSVADAVRFPTVYWITSSEPRGTVRLEEPLAVGLAAKVKVCVADGAADVVAGEVVVIEVVDAPAGLRVPLEAGIWETVGVARPGVMARVVVELAAGGGTGAVLGFALEFVLEPVLGFVLAVLDGVVAAADDTDAVPIGTVPIEAVPVDAVPADIVPVDVVPVDAVPIEAVPVAAVFVDAVPIVPELVDAGLTLLIDGVVLIDAAPLDVVLSNGGKAASVVVVDEVEIVLLLVELIAIVVLVLVVLLKL